MKNKRLIVLILVILSVTGTTSFAFYQMSDSKMLSVKSLVDEDILQQTGSTLSYTWSYNGNDMIVYVTGNQSVQNMIENVSYPVDFKFDRNKVSKTLDTNLTTSMTSTYSIDDLMGKSSFGFSCSGLEDYVKISSSVNNKYYREKTDSWFFNTIIRAEVILSICMDEHYQASLSRLSVATAENSVPIDITELNDERLSVEENEKVRTLLERAFNESSFCYEILLDEFSKAGITMVKTVEIEPIEVDPEDSEEVDEDE